MLTRLGSNQKSSEPKSDVLPITLRVSFSKGIRIFMLTVQFEGGKNNQKPLIRFHDLLVLGRIGCVKLREYLHGSRFFLRGGF